MKIKCYCDSKMQIWISDMHLFCTAGNITSTFLHIFMIVCSIGMHPWTLESQSHKHLFYNYNEKEEFSGFFTLSLPCFTHIWTSSSCSSNKWCLLEHKCFFWGFFLPSLVHWQQCLLMSTVSIRSTYKVKFNEMKFNRTGFRKHHWWVLSL